MRLLVCGSRTIDDDDGAFSDELIRIHGGWDQEARIKTIIHGGARGADTLADNWAKAWNVPVEVYFADWDKHGKSAGYIRNKEMIDSKPDMVIAFWDGVSKGTKHTIDLARQNNIPLRIINI